MDDQFVQVVRARPEVLPEVRRRIRRSLGDGAALGPRLVVDVEIAVTEAVANAVVHAYADDGAGEIVVSARRTDGALIVAERDRRVGIGLSLIAALTTALTVERADPGTRVEMTFALSGGP
jgi:anti-sigma regulatory factor (Ser/Thr protein kinase)